jgi:hypothetical protein
MATSCLAIRSVDFVSCALMILRWRESLHSRGAGRWVSLPNGARVSPGRGWVVSRTGPDAGAVAIRPSSASACATPGSSAGGTYGANWRLMTPSSVVSTICLARCRRPPRRCVDRDDRLVAAAEQQVLWRQKPAGSQVVPGGQHA